MLTLRLILVWVYQRIGELTRAFCEVQSMQCSRGIKKLSQKVKKIKYEVAHLSLHSAVQLLHPIIITIA